MAEAGSNRARIRRAAIALARIAWVLNLGSLIALLVYIVPRRREVMMFEALTEFSYSLVFENLPLGQFQGYFVALQTLVVVVYVVVGTIIFIRKSTDFVGALTSFALISCGYTIMFSDSLDRLNPGGWMGDILDLLNSIVMTTGFISIPLVLYVFPDGKIQPRQLARFLFFAGPVYLAVFAFLFISPTVVDQYWGVSITIIGIVVLAGMVGQFIRYFRISNWSQRQQTKWVVFGLLLIVVSVLISLWDPGGHLRFDRRAVYELIKIHLGLLVILFLPVSIAISVLKHRLYDIDLIIRRGLQYFLMTGFLALVYFGGVVGLQWLLTSLFGVRTGSTLITVFTTLAIAAMFNPLRRTTQQWIDRRFFRAKYDAEQELAGFARRARDEVDLDRLAGSLLDVVGQTVRPVKSSLWMRGNGDRWRA
jgi:hypothetical protein